VAELQRTLASYVQERDALLATIRAARTEARKETIQASACRQTIPPAVIDHWQRQIKDSAAELMSVEQKIGHANKALRALKAVSKPTIKSLAQLPDGVAPRVEPAPPKSMRENGQINNRPKEGHVLFLQFFHQLVCENIDPRLVEVLERDAHCLVDDYRATHPKEAEP
jgi:hypothetical protein